MSRARPSPLPFGCGTRREHSPPGYLPPISRRIPSPALFHSLSGTKYQKLLGNGIDDDFPVTWNASNVQLSGPMEDPSPALPLVDDLTSESQMHSLETEAYNAVLRAFHAQSDRLTWERESLISELRKELRVSDVEHREFLLRVKSENSVKMIREWHDNAGRKKKMLSNTVNAPLKKQKTAHVPVSTSPCCMPCISPSTEATDFPLAPLSLVKGRSSLVVQTKKVLSNMGNETSNRGCDLVHILATDKLIAKIEAILREKPNPWQVQKVKLILGEHERALRDALEKLGDVSIEDDSPDHLHEHDSYEDMLRFGHGSCNLIFGHVDGWKRGSFTEALNT